MTTRILHADMFWYQVLGIQAKDQVVITASKTIMVSQIKAIKALSRIECDFSKIQTKDATDIKSSSINQLTFPHL